VLTTDAVQIRPNAKVDVVRWGGQDTLAGRVVRVEPSAFTQVSALGVEEQRVNVIIEFAGDRAERSLLGDGYRVETEIVIWEADNVTVVPASAVFRSGQAWAVFTAVDGRARLVSVDIGRQSDTDVEVRSGVKVGACVIVHPSDRVHDGVGVEGRGSTRCKPRD
jgi:HlyD family secretion protein